MLPYYPRMSVAISTTSFPLQSPLAVKSLGLQPYREVWLLQRRIQKEVIEGRSPDTLLWCQHHPIITCGRNAKPESLLVSPTKLSKNGIALLHVERGGDMTYHGPGQLIGYPIIDLRGKRRDVHWYMRVIEEAIIRTLEDLNLTSVRRDGETGVWVEHRGSPPLKIASLGVRISRWVTMHGFSVNVSDCSWGFSHIHPCGFKDRKTTSLEQEGINIDIYGVQKTLESHFCDLFGFSS